MSASDKSSKTEKPTPKRLREAREKGQIPKSPDLVAWASLLVLTLVFQLVFTSSARVLSDIMGEVAREVAHPDAGRAARLFGSSMLAAIAAILPLLALAVVAGTVGYLAQVGLKPSLKRLQPKFSNLNPLNGLKQLFKVQNLWKLLKELAKLAVLGFMAWRTAQAVVPAVIGVGTIPVSEVARAIAAASVSLVRDVALAGLVISVVDYGVQRRTVMGNLKMSKEEIKQEFKQYEGDPHVKQAIRGRMMQMSRLRMMSAVAEADVVVTNPTHFAVAVKYDPKLGAPRVVAKGRSYLALKIRERALENRVPVVEDPPLARTLYKSVELNASIPPELYRAVAQLLAFIYAMRNKGAAAGRVHKLPKSLVA